jgi:hypothetical protein
MVFLKKLLILTSALVFVGCASTKMKTYDQTGFPITNTNGITFKTTLNTGIIKTGHSSWISTSDFSKGQDPEYYCGDKERHSWSGELWMFDLKSQENLINNLDAVLKSNNMFDENSQYELNVHFERIYQGERDEPVYNFEANVTILEGTSILYSKHHKVVGNDISEEYWTTDSWNGAKKRATNRFIEKVVSDLNTNMGKIGI